ncbi:tail fiber protein [Flavobacterium sp. CF136]|uniref:tail fiber protein n=1 Tax=Flavobacterium sp. (strain CF136) TaxID=1144313 RepID=UPI0002719FA5|nr:tail fiber protein [Flavobacterium sp. CF136]EJL62660.1 hypothetical protein PMI10_02844 [Flavobacterium sp. CF136]
MKKLVLLGLFAVNSAFAQYNYGSQNILYSSPKAVTIGSSTQIAGYQGVDDRGLEVYSPTFSMITLKTGSYAIQLYNSPFGNSFLLPNNFPFNFSIGAINAMKIQTNGNIAIGTDLNPADYKLAVGGKIIAEELKVQLQSAPWPDYVFRNDYKLPTLEEVEKQIQEKGHLINMPSATEVKENGFEVGEMTRIQQEKIEELTLYIIKLNQQLKAQEKRMQALEAKVNN